MVLISGVCSDTAAHLATDGFGDVIQLEENSSCELPSNICKLQACAVSAMTVLLTILLSIVLCAQGEISEAYIQPGPPDFCHRGSYHIMLKTRSIKTPHRPKTAVSRSACTHALTVEIQRHENQGLYNWTYDTCGSLSPECAKYLRVSIILYVLLTITLDYDIYCYYNYVENSVCL